jgi:hypothetical protein
VRVSLKNTSPQRLKAAIDFEAFDGVAEAAPFQNRFKLTHY